MPSLYLPVRIRSQRAPDGGAYIVGCLVERVVVFGLEAIPLEHAVLWLLKLRRPLGRGFEQSKTLRFAELTIRLCPRRWRPRA